MIAIECQVCGKESSVHGQVKQDDPPEPWLAPCEDCSDKYSFPLLEAMKESGDFTARLRSGETVRFREATIGGDWVTLAELISDFQGIPCIHVRLADIVWCAKTR